MPSVRAVTVRRASRRRKGQLRPSTCSSAVAPIRMCQFLVTVLRLSRPPPAGTATWFALLDGGARPESRVPGDSGIL